MWGGIPRPLSAARLDTTNSFHLQDNRNEAIGAGFVNVTKHDSYEKRCIKNVSIFPLMGGYCSLHPHRKTISRNTTKN
jgi:hypothetical protein